MMFLWVVTGLPGVSDREILLTPLEVCDGVTMNPWPPGEKVQPRAKSACPPAPDQYRPPMVSEAACPNRSTSLVALIE